jgi:hypothetical protein
MRFISIVLRGIPSTAKRPAQNYARLRRGKKFRRRVERIFVCGLLVIAFWTFFRWATPSELSLADDFDAELIDSGFGEVE